jgi:hypothetical protein
MAGAAPLPGSMHTTKDCGAMISPKRLALAYSSS